MDNELVLVLDFGGQYSQLISRRIRELNVYCEIVSYNISIDQIKNKNPKGIVFTGGPASVMDPAAPMCDKNVLTLGIPILGICYGMQLLGFMTGGVVNECDSREYGKVDITFNSESRLLKGISQNNTCWMSHTYYVKNEPKGFVVTANTSNCSNAAMENEEYKFYGVQFHPEVEHTPCGRDILTNFLFDICCCKGDWKMSSFIDQSIKDIRDQVGTKKVLCALSGGVDSFVAAVLLNKAVGKQLSCIFVDHGLLRKYEAEEVEHVATTQFDMNFIKAEAANRFLMRLKGIDEPEEKRKIIGNEFIKVFEEQAKKIGDVDFLVQGTIYPDVIESGLGHSAVIKSHHNVGGLPDVINFRSIIEPLRNLFKDEVRLVGQELGLPDHIVFRQPFPGPGLAIRIIGDITEDKLEILKDADYIFREEILKSELSNSINQYFAVLTGMRSVGVMGDERTYDYTIALRGVTTTDFMTADWTRIPYDVLEKISSRIVNEVKHVNRIVYDITSKPPATIEWE